MAAAAKMKLKLMVNKASNGVVFAECDSEFVDILFSFLTLPMGAIIHLSGKETKMGCVDVLYQSLEELDKRYFQNKACKSMLLQPRSSTELKCANLAVNYVAAPTGYHLYGCCDPTCGIYNRLVSDYNDCQCSCGRIMNYQLTVRCPVGSTDHGVFVQGKRDFLVRDDLQVIPVVATSSMSIMKKIGLTDGNSVEARNVEIGLQEVLCLLKCALQSQTALTDAFLSKPTEQVKLKTDDQKISKPREQVKPIKRMARPSRSSTLIKQTETDGRRMVGKLVINRSTKQVLYLEAKEDLVNQILSFLTFPLGSVLKLIRGRSPLMLGCVGNIYEAARDFGTDELRLFNSEESKAELLGPSLGPFLGCDGQLLTGLVQAISPPFYTAFCSRYGHDPPCSRDIVHTKPRKCKHGVSKAKLKPINPKLSNAVREKGGGFVKMNTKYMITDELSIKPLSSSTVLLLMNKVTANEVEEQDISIGEEEAVKLLRAAMTSKTVLTDVFCPKKEEHQVLSPELSTVSEIEEQFVFL
ncbi:hypothetical protein H6P81_017354 [Aristolochia fimbriata]|uniref:DUF674 family protein n=1 Tax=Aristolochia fimbriata TaxID=158543 RepID=A0AAV7DXX4_ARIFI|nr:hypothetical protein H6P81_017354 [Aristolochia fimbriata]